MLKPSHLNRAKVQLQNDCIVLSYILNSTQYCLSPTAVSHILHLYQVFKSRWAMRQKKYFVSSFRLPTLITSDFNP